MSSGLTPMRDLQEQGAETLEEDFSDITKPDFSPSLLTKIKKIKLSLKNQKELSKHVTYEKIESLRLRKDKRLLIMQIKKLQQVSSDLGLETGLINKGNRELRETSFKNLVKIVNSALKDIQGRKQKAGELTEFANNQLELAENIHQKLKKKAKRLNLTEKRHSEEKTEITRNKQELEKVWKKVLNIQKELEIQKKQQKLNLQRSEINSKVSEKRVKQIDTIYEDIEKKEKAIERARLQIKADRESIKQKEEHLKIREVAVKDHEEAVRRLAKEVV